MIGPHAINSSPCANRQNHSLFLCRSGRARMEGPAGGQTVPRRAGKKKKGPALSGVCSRGVTMSSTLALLKAGPWESPLLAPAGVLSFKEGAH